MKSYSFFLSVFLPAFLFFVSACKSPSANQPEFGTIDTLAIAADTAMQHAIENSYEFHKSLMVNQSLVYDVTGRGNSLSEGEFTITRRSTGNRPDTLFTGKRDGVFTDALLTRLNSNQNEQQLVIITRQPGSGAYGNVLLFSVPAFEKISLSTSFVSAFKNKGYMGHDSIYVEDNRLVREFPLYKKDDSNCCPTGGKVRLTCTVKNNELIIQDTQLSQP